MVGVAKRSANSSRASWMQHGRSGEEVSKLVEHGTREARDFAHDRADNKQGWRRQFGPCDLGDGNDNSYVVAIEIPQINLRE